MEMNRIHNGHRPPLCGECTFFDREDADDHGTCRITGCMQRCSSDCHFAGHRPSLRQSERLLHYIQKWRRGNQGSEKMPSPFLQGVAMDEAIHRMREFRALLMRGYLQTWGTAF